MCHPFSLGKHPLGKILGDIADVVAVATGNAELLPLIGGVQGAISNPKNPLLGGLEGTGEAFAAGQIGNFVGDQLGITGSDISNSLGINDLLGSAKSGINDFSNSLGFGSPFSETGGGTLEGSLGSTGSPTTGAPVVGSGGGGGGGFQSPSSLLSGSQTQALDQFGNSGASGSLVPGASTETSTSLGNLGGVDNSSGLESGGGLTFGGQSSPGLGSTSSAGATSSGFQSPSADGLSSGGGSSSGGGPSFEGGLSSTPSTSTGATSVSSLSSTSPGNFLPDVSAAGNNATLGITSGTPSAGFGQKALDFLTDPSNLKSILPLGALANTLISGPQKLTSAAQALDQGGAVTGPLQTTEQQSLNAYNTQTLTPSQQSQIDQYVQQAKNQLYQELAASGVTNPQGDSRYVQGLQQIQQQAESMKQGLLGQDLQAGQSAAGQASGNLAGVAQLQNQADEDYQKAIEQAISSFSQAQGGGSLQSIEQLLKGG